MARPTKLSEELRERIVRAIRAGNYAEVAARSCGISPSSHYRWLQRGSRENTGIYHEFAEAIHRAEAESETYAIAVIRSAMPSDWRAALAFVERRHPERWRRQTTTELTGKDGGPIRTATAPSIDLSLLSGEELDMLEEMSERATRQD